MRVVLTPDAAVQFSALPLAIQARTRKLFARLTAWPQVSGVQPLRGPLSGQYRLRTGDYRVQFHVLTDVVVIVKIGHRDGFYDQ